MLKPRSSSSAPGGACDSPPALPKPGAGAGGAPLLAASSSEGGLFVYELAAQQAQRGGLPGLRLVTAPPATKET